MSQLLRFALCDHPCLHPSGPPERRQFGPIWHWGARTNWNHSRKPEGYYIDLRAIAIWSLHGALAYIHRSTYTLSSLAQWVHRRSVWWADCLQVGNMFPPSRMFSWWCRFLGHVFMTLDTAQIPNILRQIFTTSILRGKLWGCVQFRYQCYQVNIICMQINSKISLSSTYNIFN